MHTTVYRLLPNIKSNTLSQILHTGPLAVLPHTVLCAIVPLLLLPFIISFIFCLLHLVFYPSVPLFSLLFGLPLLPVGPVSVHLSSPLSLEEIRRRNPLVSPGGHYQPPDCRPRHHTAIVVPYRNRQNHLRALLYHLHPFLQRQQIHYSIYIVQQVRQQLLFLFCCFPSTSWNPVEQILTHFYSQIAFSLHLFSATRGIQAFWTLARQVASCYLVLGWYESWVALTGCSLEGANTWGVDSNVVEVLFPFSEIREDC